MNILNEYDEVLIGHQKEIPRTYFIFDSAGNERSALSVFRYAIECLLEWTPADAAQLLSPYYVKVMHLDQLLDYIRYPSDVTKDDTEYIVHLLYPKIVPYDIRKYAIRVYENVLNGKQKYPKDYMYGYLGLLRARICLIHSLNQDKLFKTTEDMYAFFSQKECITYLREKQLFQLYKAFFDSPVEYIHSSLPDRAKNDFLYQNYLFLYLFKGKALKSQYHFLEPGK